MSDRTRGSVRTGARDADAAPDAPSDAVPDAQAVPASSTQSITPTGQARAHAAVAVAPGAARAEAGPATGSGRPSAAAGTVQGATRAGAAGEAAAVPPPGAVPPPAAAVPPPVGAYTGNRSAAGPPTRSGRPGAPPPQQQQKGGRGAGRGPRRARLQLRHVDIWSAFKISLVLSIALFFIWMVTVGILYGVLSSLGVFRTVNDLAGQLGGSAGSGGGSKDPVTPGVVLGSAAVIGAVNILVLTALCTVATFIYNMCADLVGGLEVTLSERD